MGGTFHRPGRQGRTGGVENQLSIDVGNNHVLASHVRVVFVSWQPIGGILARSDDASDTRQARSLLEQLLESRCIRVRGETLVQFNMQNPFVRMQHEAIQQTRILKERMQVHFLIDTCKSMIGCDHKGRAIFETSLLYSSTKNSDAAIHLGDGRLGQVVGGAVFMLSFVRCKEVNGDKLRLVLQNGIGRGLGENRIGDELCIVVVARIKINRNVCLAKLSEERRVQSLRARPIVRVEDLWNIEVDGWVCLRFRPKERGGRQTCFLATSNSVGTFTDSALVLLVT